MKISNEIINILDDLGKRLGLAIDWSGQNIMPYLKELMGRFITWEITTSIIWIVLGIVMTIIGVIVAINVWKQKDEHTYFGDFDEKITWVFIVSLGLAATGIIITVFQCFDICRAVYLPEISIYKYIERLISTSNANL